MFLFDFNVATLLISTCQFESSPPRGKLLACTEQWNSHDQDVPSCNSLPDPLAPVNTEGLLQGHPLVSNVASQEIPFKCKVFNGEKHINNKGFSITTFDYRIILSFVDGCCTKCGWPIWDGFLMFSGNHPNVWPEKYWNDTLQKNNMQPTNPNAHTYVNGTDVETHGYTFFPCYHTNAA